MYAANPLGLGGNRGVKNGPCLFRVDHFGAQELQAVSPRLGTLFLTQGQPEPGAMAGAELGQHHREGAAAKG